MSQIQPAVFAAWQPPNATCRLLIIIKTSGEGIHLLNAYKVEPMLRQVKKTSPGKDKIPFWVFSQCSVELADIVAHGYSYSMPWRIVVFLLLMLLYIPFCEI